MDTNLGKILRLHDDGPGPADNPFVHLGGIGAQIWSPGHRNVLGLAFDGAGRLWEVEMGPEGGIWLLEDGNGGRLIRYTSARWPPPKLQPLARSYRRWRQLNRSNS